ncbi:MAG: acetolactate synthase small subunit [Candidatus Omnitrophica bacterium]|nr:acetolactate synthase small subunit [Candidatus Omnitrophota bacterium]
MNATNGAITAKTTPSHTISVLVHNRPGVLSRIAQVFARRGFNIDSLVVSEAHQEGFSRMTIVSLGEPEALDQIIKQLNKLVDVVRAAEHVSGESVERELALIKVTATPETRTELLQIIDVFRAKTVDISDDSLTIEVTGDSSKLDAMEEMLGKFGIIEMIRSGKLIIARGSLVT